MAKKASRKPVEAEVPIADPETPSPAPRKRRTGRPRKAEGTVRGHLMMLRLSQTEDALLTAIAAAAELDKSAVLRLLLRRFGWRLSGLK